MSGKLIAPIATSSIETGYALPFHWVWTGASSPGAPGYPETTCEAWTDSTSTARAFVGEAVGTMAQFFNIGGQTLPCNQTSDSVYCLQR